MAGTETLHKPLCLLAELTHRFPLGCPYCSNPLALEPRDGELDAATWARVFKEAAALGASRLVGRGEWRVDSNPGKPICGRR